MASRILGMGDVLTLIEQAEKAFDVDQAAEMATKIGGDLTLEDFLDQLLAIRRMGPIGNLLGMLPGMGQLREQLEQVDDRDLDRVMAIIRSMTPEERANPKILQASRKARVARGAGVTVTEINQLLDRFEQARKMMKQMAGGLGLPGMGRAAKAVKGSKGKRGKNKARSGNPRTAAAQRAAAEEKAAARPASPFALPPGLADGTLGADAPPFDAAALEAAMQQATRAGRKQGPSYPLPGGSGHQR
jgi:signal recognition particle subunit SRP54